MSGSKPYPALLVDWLTPLYDLFAKLFMPERQFKQGLIAQAHLAPGQRVLDLGAGTGTLAIMLKQSHPKVQVVGLDGDPEILTIARNKATQANTEITFDLGNATSLPYPAGSFDRVVSSLVFSLLNTEDKQKAIQEVYRVLRPKGEFHLGDFGPPHTRWGRWLSPLMHRFEPIADNLDGRLPEMFRDTGFETVEESIRFATFLGTLSIVSGNKPNSP